MPRANILELDAPMEFHQSIDPKYRRWDWPIIISIGLFHLVSLAAPFTFTWSGFVLFIALLWISGIGITGGFHRLLTHRAFKTQKWVEWVFTIAGTLALQGSPAHWVGTHRLHHRHTERAMDPHSPRHGAFWAHVQWTLMKDGPGFVPLNAARDLAKGLFMMWINEYFWAPQVILGSILAVVAFLWGGFPLVLSWLVWAIAFRTVVMYHGTWAVNSASHMFGYQSNATGDDSRNNWWVAFLAFGEGWHNNHHANANAAWHGWRWWEIDVTGRFIWILSKIRFGKYRLAWDLQPSGPLLKPHLGTNLDVLA